MLLQDSEPTAQGKPEQREGEGAQQEAQLSDGEQAQSLEVVGKESRSARRRRLRAATAKRLQQAREPTQEEEGGVQQPQQEAEFQLQAGVEVEEQVASTRRQRRRRRVAAAKKAAAEAARAGHSIPAAADVAEAALPGAAATSAADVGTADSARLALAVAAGGAEPGQEQEQGDRRHRSPSSVRASQVFFERVSAQRKKRQAAKLARGQQQGSNDPGACHATASGPPQGQELSPAARAAVQHAGSQDSAPVAVLVAAGELDAASAAAAAGDSSSEAALLAPQKKRRRKRTSLEWFELRERRKQRCASQQAEQAEQGPGEGAAGE